MVDYSKVMKLAEAMCEPKVEMDQDYYSPEDVADAIETLQEYTIKDAIMPRRLRESSVLSPEQKMRLYRALEDGTLDLGFFR